MMRRYLPWRALFVAACLALCVGHSALAQPSPWYESYRLEALGQYAEAQARIETLATQQPAHEFAVLRTAWLLYLQGRFVDSEKRYLSAAAMNPRADRKSTRLNSSHVSESRMPSSA